jgi:hypothetical protein
LLIGCKLIVKRLYSPTFSSSCLTLHLLHSQTAAENFNLIFRPFSSPFRTILGLEQFSGSNNSRARTILGKDSRLEFPILIACRKVTEGLHPMTGLPRPNNFHRNNHCLKRLDDFHLPTSYNGGAPRIGGGRPLKYINSSQPAGVAGTREVV